MDRMYVSLCICVYVLFCCMFSLISRPRLWCMVYVCMLVMDSVRGRICFMCYFVYMYMYTCIYMYVCECDHYICQPGSGSGTGNLCVSDTMSDNKTE